MTISVCVVVNDGLVLASDSATTLRLSNGDAQVYNNADKIFNLFKGLPIGAATWGMGAIGSASMATLSKDFRQKISNSSNSDPKAVVAPWGICTDNYTVSDLVERFRKFLDERLAPVLAEIQKENDSRAAKKAAGETGPLFEPLSLDQFFFRVAGYGSESCVPEVWDFSFDGKQLGAATLQTGKISWGGQVEAVQRLVIGIDDRLVQGMMNVLGVDEANAVALARTLLPHTETQLLHPAMPISDAVDLAEFLADTAIKYSRFVPGAPTVGGPIEIATITRHEGFKWIKRKHFYSRELNPST